MREWRPRDQSSFKEKRKEDKSVVGLLVTEKIGAKLMKNKLTEAKKIRLEVMLRRCTWEERK